MFSIYRTITALSIFVSLSVANADPKELLYQQHLIEVMRIVNSSSFGIKKGDISLLSIPAAPSSFTQVLDHNNSKDQRTFEQRYWVSKSNALNENSPTLLYICGEGACSSSNLMYLSEQASLLNANVVALEHRYYGKSQPFSDLKTANLKYLSVDQALKDIVVFKKYAEEKYSLKGPWITVGGSYPGALSAYARTLYPQEFLGSLASSAPVQADLDFSEYDHHVAKISGAKCLSAIQKAVQEIEKAIVSDEGFATTKKEFNASVLEERDDFLYLIADTAAAAIQYGMRDEFCRLLENEGRAGYAKGTAMVAQLFGNLTGMSAQAAMDTSLAAHDGSIGIRQWFYQSCTEFGFWQNAWPDAKESSRSSRINSNYHAQLCKRLFDLDQPAPVEETNKTYFLPMGSLNAPQILFTNGNEDPWMNLSVTAENKKQINPDLDVMVIEGGAHCNDLDASDVNPNTRKARQLFINLSQGWLSNGGKKH